MQQNLTEELRQGLADFAAFVPRLAAAIGILMIGFLAAKMLERVTHFVLSRIGFDRWMREGGVTEALERAGTALKPSSVVARLTFWGVMLLVIIIGANALGITAVSLLFGELLAYVPNVIAAVIVLILGTLLGEFVKDLVLASAGGLAGALTLARAAKAAVILLASFMALEQLDIAQDIVLVFFIAVVGAAALAAAIAFGVGGRDVARHIVQEWYARSRASTGHAKRADAAATPGPAHADEPTPDR
ncbi:MAG: hypothetical protein L0271_17825 [Gemmatimonadetes bacterium]|nr:hypothetical protein [Gemmatimonadota bacterium]